VREPRRDWLLLGSGATAERLAAIVGKRVALHRRGDRWTGLCPFHNEKTPSFAVYRGVKDGHGRYHCHGCGASGDAVDWLRKMEGMSYGEAVKALNGELKLTPDPRIPERTEAARRTDALHAYRDRNPDCCLPDWAIDA
jgi:DNA primase